MTKQTLKAIVRKTVSVSKVVAISAVVVLALVGGYVVSQGALRNEVIDHAQGQNEIVSVPKAN